MTLGFAATPSPLGADTKRVVGLSPQVLDRLMPMHLWLDRQGRVMQAGPTIAKMMGGAPALGTRLLDLVEIRSPSNIADFTALIAQEGRRLSLGLHCAPHLPLRGVVSSLPGQGGALLDISLGLSFVRAVAEFDLNQGDFSPCDQTLELLYLYEANTSIAHLSRRLTERLRAARLAAEAQALTDELTGLANRRAMDLELARVLADETAHFALLHLDLDYFKQVNDTHGHAAGDHVLQQVGHILRSDLRRGDLAARVGGDEFLIILRNCLSEDGLREVAKRLIAGIEAPVSFEGKLCKLSASIGISTTAGYRTRPTPDEMLADTDMALYRAKNAGRRRFAIHLPERGDGGAAARDAEGHNAN
ncbi:GGDEF domain-containing protein [Roseibacterium beibuensis]|uniref:GGDEF domain-containing protein n=1 Tax=[Roseibacterium] beibuensis TaxID=1193142 RepID=A0ABP9L4D1_9RHOB|nr:GGDEF domain-containing protein [Roseibacterium beibuensis]MCS6623788.1 GGDEF domain-containing protein [Roseibacterium beibuensis]